MTKYAKAVEWIALNDDPGCDHCHDLDTVANMISVSLVADVFNKYHKQVANDIIKLRLKLDQLIK